MDAEYHEAIQSRNEFKHKVEGFQKDIQFLNKSLSMYGYTNEDS